METYVRTRDNFSIFARSFPSSADLNPRLSSVHRARACSVKGHHYRPGAQCFLASGARNASGWGQELDLDQHRAVARPAALHALGPA